MALAARLSRMRRVRLLRIACMLALAGIFACSTAPMSVLSRAEAASDRDVLAGQVRPDAAASARRVEASAADPTQAAADGLAGQVRPDAAASARRVEAGAADPTQAAADGLTGAPTKANLVLLVRFKGDQTGDDGSGYNAPYPYKPEMTEWQALMKEYNGDPTGYFRSSMSGYFATVSDSKMELRSYFPQTIANGHVAYLTMPEPFESYSSQPNDYKFAQDALAEFNRAYPDYDASVADADGNGDVDNVTFVTTLPQPPVQGDKFWPHMAPIGNYGLVVGTGAKSRLLANCNILDSGNLSAYTVGLMCHEFMHSLGAMDYYRKPSYLPGAKAGKPVGPWDIMSVALSPLFRPLAITREDLGWTTVPQVSASGTYTLNAPESGKPQSFMFKTPMSDDEYFMVEYRKKGDDINGLDSRIGGSGIVVYRVNPIYKKWGNWGDDDYVYLFRPGETGLGDAQGDITHAQASLSSDAVWSSIGSTDRNATVEQGAIVYSDGRNSGVEIKALSQTDDSLTFSLTFSDQGDGGWNSVAGPDGVSQFGTEVYNVCSAADGHAYYACLEQGLGSGRTYRVMSYADGAWHDLGAPLAGDFGDAVLAVHEGSLYWCASDYSSGSLGLQLRRWNEASGAWDDVAHLSTGSVYVQSLAMKSVGGSLCVVAGTTDIPPQVYRLNEAQTGLEALGGALPVGSITAPSLVEVGGKPAVACGDFSTDQTSLYRFDGGAWHATTLFETASAGVTDVVSEGGKAYIIGGFSPDGGSDSLIYTIDSDGNIAGKADVSWLAGGTLLGGRVALNVKGAYLYATVVEGAGFEGGEAKTYATPRKNVSGAQGDWSQLGEAVYPSASGVAASIVDNQLYVGALNPQTSKVAFRSHETLVDPDVISVSVPSSASFMVDPSKEGDAAAQIEGPDNLKITNNSTVPVWVSVSDVAVDGVSLVSTVGDLSLESSLMLALSDEMPTGFDTVGDWLPAASPAHPAHNFCYIPFNRAEGGMIAAASSSGSGSDSPVMRLYGKASAHWGTGAGSQFKVTPTFTLSTHDPRDSR